MARRRRTFRPKFHRGSRSRSPVAHVRRTWIQSLLVDPCDPQLIPICDGNDGEPGCCTTRWEQVLVDNQVLEDKFSDRATVVRSIGDVLIALDPRIGGISGGEVYTRLAAAAGSLYVQLIKRPVDKDGNSELPPDIWDSSSVIEAFSEGKAMKTWWHHWNPFDQFGFNTSLFRGAFQTSAIQHEFQDCSGDTVGLWGAGTAPGTMSIGSSAPDCIPDTPVEPLKLAGNCVECGEIDLFNAGVGSDTYVLRGLPAWRFKFDLKKHISLREDEQLSLDFQFRSQISLAFTDMQFQVFGGGIKTLMQF